MLSCMLVVIHSASLRSQGSWNIWNPRGRIHNFRHLWRYGCLKMGHPHLMPFFSWGRRWPTSGFYWSTNFLRHDFRWELHISSSLVKTSMSWLVQTYVYFQIYHLVLSDGYGKWPIKLDDLRWFTMIYDDLPLENSWFCKAWKNQIEASRRQNQHFIGRPRGLQFQAGSCLLRHPDGHRTAPVTWNWSSSVKRWFFWVVYGQFLVLHQVWGFW